MRTSSPPPSSSFGRRRLLLLVSNLLFLRVNRRLARARHPWRRRRRLRLRGLAVVVRQLKSPPERLPGARGWSSNESWPTVAAEVSSLTMASSSAYGIVELDRVDLESDNRCYSSARNRPTRRAECGITGGSSTASGSSTHLDSLPWPVTLTGRRLRSGDGA